MPFPKISIAFKQAATAAIQAGERGIVALVLKDVVAQAGQYHLISVTEIPAGLSTYNKEQITRAFTGGVTVPRKIIAVVQDSTIANYTASLDYLETQKYDYLALPGISSSDANTVATWVKSQRDTKGKKIKVVLPNVAGDHEGIINLVSDVKIGATVVTAKDFCSRMAGVFAGTPLHTSATFYPLQEVSDTVSHPTEDAVGADIDAGRLVLFHDGEKVKIARAVNSLVTTTADKGSAFKKIKIVDILDMMAQDIKRTSEDNYIGKVPNSYTHKLLLMNAVNAYFGELETSGLLERGMNHCEIDVVAQKNYLKGMGVAVDEMSVADIKVANTGSNVFLTTSVKPLDAMEDIILVVNL